jgi:hypothetical protein
MGQWRVGRLEYDVMNEIKWTRREWNENGKQCEHAWACYPDGLHAGKLWRERMLENGELVEEREYAYYGPDEQGGRPGCLKSAVRKGPWSGVEPTVHTYDP